MKPQIPWLRIVAEGVVIVVSILLAFGLEAWWSRAEARRQARQELVSVLDEVAAGRAAIERVALWHERCWTGTAAVQSVMAGTPLNGVATLPDTLLASLQLMQVADVPTDVVEAFLSSGQIGDLGNFIRDDRLVGWDAADHRLHRRPFTLIRLLDVVEVHTFGCGPVTAGSPSTGP